jgi:hypothetical protein
MENTDKKVTEIYLYGCIYASKEKTGILEGTNKQRRFNL